MRATTGGASASRPRPLTRRQQKIVAVARRSVTAQGHEVQQVARAYKRLNLTPAEQRLANRAAEQHGAHLRKLQGSNLHNFVSDAQKISQGLLDTAGLHGAAHPIRRLENPGGELMFPGFGKNPSSLVKGLRKAERVPVYPEHMPAEVQASAKKVITHMSLGGVKKAQAAKALAISEERAKRLGAAEGAMQQTPGVKGYHAAKHEMRGPMAKPEFNVLRDKLNPKEVEGLHTYISNHPTLRKGDKLTAHRGLEKAYNGEVPAPHEWKMLNKAFGPEFVAALHKGLGVKDYKRLGLEIANIPRSFEASADVSAPFRQALMAGARHPVMFSKNLPSMLKQFGSEAYHQEVMARLHKSPLFQDFVDHGGSFTELGSLNRREEGFMSNLAEKLNLKIPGTTHSVGPGHVVRASGRAYVGFLDSMRMQMYEHHVEQAQKFYGGALDEAQKRGLTDFINNATGRGNLGRFQGSAVHLNTLFFSPRLLASRVHFLRYLVDPTAWAKLDPYTRRQVLRSMVGLVGFVGSILEVAHLAGAHVEMDPRNADWAKIKIGNTRIDLLGGFQQPIRLAAQYVTGKVISSTTGDTLTLGPGLGNMNRQDILKRFFEGKLAPIPSVINDWQKGQDFHGQPFSWKNEATSRLFPLSFQDAKDLYNDRGNIPLAVGGYAVGATGIGVQTYGPKDNTRAAKESNAKLTQAFEQNLRHYYHMGVTPQIKKALRLRQAREVYLAKNLSSKSTALDRYNAQVDLMVSMKMLTPRQGKEAKAWAVKQDPHKVKSATASIGREYFGGSVLSEAAKQIRERGGHLYLGDF